MKIAKRVFRESEKYVAAREAGGRRQFREANTDLFMKKVKAFEPMAQTAYRFLCGAQVLDELSASFFFGKGRGTWV